MLSVFGIGINKNYCCGKLLSITFFSQHSNKKNCKSKSMAGCCKTEKAFYKLSDSHENAATALVVNNSHLVVAVINDNCFQKTFSTSSITYLSDHSNDPPEKKQLPVYLMNCNFRI